MCGLIGFTRSSDIDEIGVAARMCSLIEHRGPDSEGIWLEESSLVVLGHRRLSVLDVSSSGSQPMVSKCGRFVLAFNGEIYNHNDLRTSLYNQGSPVDWVGNSDTETLLACISTWGIQETLQAVVGMFAVAVWDKHTQVLTLARDRLGEKPLYWGWCKGTLLFSSELKALRAHPQFKSVIDRDSLALYLRHGYIPAPYSIYTNINKLLPGHLLSISLGEGEAIAKACVPSVYWNFNEVVEDGLANPICTSPEEAVDLLEERLISSISGQMLSDVPLGAFLSGGIDSSTVAAIMQKCSGRPVRTFTIGFDDSGYNEAVHAKSVADHLGTDHTELYVGSKEAMAVIPSLANMYCEPFSDSSQIPTYLVSKLARKHVTVALSGDGGDELFGGYNRYLMAKRIWKYLQFYPAPLRKAMASALRIVPAKNWNKLFDNIRSVLPARLQVSMPGDKAFKLADVMSVSDEHAFFYNLVSSVKKPTSIVRNSIEPQTKLSASESWPNVDCFEHWMMAMDAQTYLPDDILVKVDRAAMASSLETRVPLLDHRIVELAWKMPLDLKIRNGQGKWALRQVLYRYVPKELIERPKMGFGVPLDAWLRGPLREWAEELLSPSRLEKEGYFYPAPIRQLWEEHLSGVRNWQQQLWSVLMFQSWLEENG
jgi:asparagine synthase (glutamine-hydrolysing)